MSCIMQKKSKIQMYILCFFLMCRFEKKALYNLYVDMVNIDLFNRMIARRGRKGHYGQF